MNNKINRLNHAFVEEISKVIEYEVKNQNIKFVTITAAKVTNDLSYAKIYFTVLDDSKRDITLKALNQSSGFIRNALFDREIREFFNRLKADDFEYKDFNIMNIIYSQMYSSIGYENTNAIFSDLLCIDDVVKLNSFDNMKIVASTESGIVIKDEGEIVEWKNPDDKINDVYFVGKSTYGINLEARRLIDDADLIIISTGTFWSSIYPTLKYKDFYKYINSSKAKKLWIVNSIEDKDSYGVTSAEFYEKMSNLGLHMENFGVIINNSAVDSLKIISTDMTKSKIFKTDLGIDTKGRNNFELVEKALIDISKFL